MTNWKIIWCWLTEHQWRLDIENFTDLLKKDLTQTCKRCGQTTEAPEIMYPLIPDSFMDAILKHNPRPLSPFFSTSSRLDDPQIEEETMITPKQSESPLIGANTDFLGFYDLDGEWIPCNNSLCPKVKENED